MRKLLVSGLIIAGLFSAMLAHSAQYQLVMSPRLGVEDAETATDLFLRDHWNGAQARVDNLTEHAAEIEDSMQHRSAHASTERLFNSLLFQLQRYAVRRKAPMDAALTANQMAALLIDFAYPRAQGSLARTAWLGYLGREVELLARMPNDYGLLGRRIAELQANWNGLRQRAVVQHHPRIAGQLQSTVADLSSTPPAPRLAHDGARIARLSARLAKAT